MQLDRFAGKVVVNTGGASGLGGLTRSVMTEADAHGVDLTLVCPGCIDTNLFAAGSFAGSVKAGRVRERIPFRFISVDTAVNRTLEVVLAKRAIAVFPGYVRLLWWIERLSPWLMTAMLRLILRQQRRQFGAGGAP